MVLSMCAHNLLFKCSLKSFHLPGNFFYLLLIAPLRLSCGAQRFMSLLLSSYFFFFNKRCTYNSAKLNCGKPKLAKRTGRHCEHALFLHFPFPFKGFVLGKGNWCVWRAVVSFSRLDLLV